jgi:hypothetical protein
MRSLFLSRRGRPMAGCCAKTHAERSGNVARECRKTPRRSEVDLSSQNIMGKNPKAGLLPGSEL